MLYGWHDLHVAAYEGALPKIRRLLRKGAYVNAVDAVGRTPLHFAARHHSPDHAVVRTLLAGGADPMARDARGRTARDVWDQYHPEETTVRPAASLVGRGRCHDGYVRM